MSFGFSVGDFVAVAGLIKRITSALQSSSSLEFRELKDELSGLQRALDSIEHLECPPSRTVELNAVKVAALSCHRILDEFHHKAAKYEILAQEHKQRGWQVSKLWTRKLQWGFTMQEEVQRLRTYIAAHVGYLNMQLTTFNNASIAVLSEQISAQNSADTRVLSNEMEALRVSTGEQSARMSYLSLTIENLTQVLSSVAVPLRALLLLVGKVWATNTQIVDLLIAQQNSTQRLATQFTWFQPPIRFENALGVPLPVPTEYNLELLHAIIRQQFKSGPGAAKVESGEYELYNAEDPTQNISLAASSPLVPGMNITMAFCIGTYKDVPLIQCPRPGCTASVSITFRDISGTCPACGLCYGLSSTPLSRPFRMPQHLNGFMSMRSDRKWYKNVRIFPNVMPFIATTVEDLDLPLSYSVNEIEEVVVGKAANLLSLNTEEISTAESLTAYGFDSLLAVDLRSWARRCLNANVAVLDIIGGESISELSEKIARSSTKENGV